MSNCNKNFSSFYTSFWHYGHQLISWETCLFPHFFNTECHSSLETSIFTFSLVLPAATDFNKIFFCILQVFFFFIKHWFYIFCANEAWLPNKWNSFLSLFLYWFKNKHCHMLQTLNKLTINNRKNISIKTSSNKNK